MHRGKIALQRCPEPTHACTYTGSLYEMMQGVDAKRLEKELELEKKKLSCTTLATEIGLRCQILQNELGSIRVQQRQLHDDDVMKRSDVAKKIKQLDARRADALTELKQAQESYDKTMAELVNVTSASRKLTKSSSIKRQSSSRQQASLSRQGSFSSRSPSR
eukprot:Tamp_19253.p4 GENE.Tamp_19253~~Tamp_19253.p4  ORF type:complete len:162 (-),score=30.20 Tamp_19253:60-545(-)